jgi:osmoprotectant transport system substrate-binding protein
VRKLLGTMAVAVLLVAACSNNKTTAGSTTASATPGSGPTIAIGSANFTESIILGSIYAQALKAKGYKVAEHSNIGARDVYFRALEAGSINLFPEYTGSTLNFLTKQTNSSKPDPKQNYDLLVSELKKVKLTALAMSDAQDQDGVVTNKETADKYNLKRVSDLKPVGSQLVFGGPPECPTRISCLKGLEQVYGIHFKSFKPLDVGGPITVRALKANGVQVADLFTTDASIAVNGFVVLEQDKPIVGAENVVPIVRDEVVAAYGPKLIDLVNSITRKLTTAGLTQLNKRVGIDKEDAKTVAADWLKTNGFT